MPKVLIGACTQQTSLRNTDWDQSKSLASLSTGSSASSWNEPWSVRPRAPGLGACSNVTTRNDSPEMAAHCEGRSAAGRAAFKVVVRVTDEQGDRPED